MRVWQRRAARWRKPWRTPAEQRVRDLKLQLPQFDTPASGNNPPFVQSGNLVFLAGLGPRNPDGSYISGRLGKDTTSDQGYQHARLAGLRALATLHDGLGSLDKVSRIVKLLGMVNATPEFTDLGRVINGCSDLLVDVFGPQRGRHARTVVGVTRCRSTSAWRSTWWSKWPEQLLAPCRSAPQVKPKG